ncbi:hypothetical protein, partial [Acinetobacter baumannii]|uniref:hypothetical protein n=1 Tax=Acinetobacter baumannii TaxID=470 RepID=UPI00300D8F67
LPVPAAPAVEAMAGLGVLGGVPVSRLAPGEAHDDVLLLAATETTTDAHIEALVAALTKVIR